LFVESTLNKPRQYTTATLGPLHKFFGCAFVVAAIVFHPKTGPLQVSQADVKRETYQCVKLALMISSSRAISGHAALKSRKVRNK
jgi:hypothetical protein